jgi:hypothetical protein
MNIKPDLSEIGKIVRDMTTDYKAAPNYNAAAAEIVKQGTEDKLRARYNYEPILTKSTPKLTPKKTL